MRLKARNRRTHVSLSAAAALAAVSATAGLFLAAGCRGPSTPSVPPAQASARFVGNDACAECHPRAHAEHAASRHDKTLQIADRGRLGQRAPRAGQIPESGYHIQDGGGRIRFVRSDRPEESAELQLALGSGKSGMTFVGQIGKDGMTEFRMSYFPKKRIWYVTPGQEGQVNLELGAVHETDKAKRCISCHAVTVPADSAMPESRFFGVGCESCHGPGGDHVAAASVRGATDLKIERLAQVGGARINALCGQCHRTLDDISLVTREASATARFQPYGLEMSPCFKKSNDRLTCITCHEPHKDASTDPRHYEKACLSCHSPLPSHSAGIETASSRKPCPVNPKEKCIGCHMPQRKVLPGSDVPVTMADHFIWSYRRKK